MLNRIYLVLDNPELDYSSFIILEQMKEELIWWEGDFKRVPIFREEDEHFGKTNGCFAVTDIEFYSGSIINYIARLKRMGYKIVSEETFY
jgi:hypothetical protein